MANSLEIGYKNFLKVDTSMFWLIDSAVDATLNFLDQIFDIFVADITRCYESIPLQGEDNLLDAIQFIVNKAFRQQKKLHRNRILSCGYELIRQASHKQPSDLLRDPIVDLGSQFQNNDCSYYMSG